MAQAEAGDEATWMIRVNRVSRRKKPRQTRITRALLGGMVPAAVQKLAGHKNIATTMKYYV